MIADFANLPDRALLNVSDSSLVSKTRQCSILESSCKLLHEIRKYCDRITQSCEPGHIVQFAQHLH